MRASSALDVQEIAYLESFIEVDISDCSRAAVPEVTATELDVVDDQPSVERRNTEQHIKRKKETYIDTKKKHAAGQEYIAQKTQKFVPAEELKEFSCKCKLECETIDQDARKTIFKSFWLLGKELGSMDSQRLKWAYGDDGESLQVKWNSIKWLNYSIERPTEIYFRYDYDSEFSVIKLNESRHRMTPNESSLQLVSTYGGPIPFPLAKYKDLIDLCYTLVIPRTFHEYYTALASSESTMDGLDELDVKEEDLEDMCIRSRLSSFYFVS
ncbi:hypothetical protein QYM36_012087 [Artemia franciscana]|uniref:Uncharacterized protein n=1 Tax=Artemia franciscana TaxID=6661 RepID=A0AA88L2I0_ARTSF|nr:hypothetical protein QYM36_012087 [Artemia franciscana]